MEYHVDVLFLYRCCELASAKRDQQNKMKFVLWPVGISFPDAGGQYRQCER